MTPTCWRQSVARLPVAMTRQCGSLEYAVTDYPTACAGVSYGSITLPPGTHHQAPKARFALAAGVTFVVVYLGRKTWRTSRADRRLFKTNREGTHAVSNHNRRLLAEAGMAGRAEHAVGAVEVVRPRIGACQTRCNRAGAQAAGGLRHRHRHRGRAGAPALRSRFSGEDRGHRLRPQGRNGNPQKPLQGDGAAGRRAVAVEGADP